MGRTPCCEKTGLNKGKWTAEEDEKLISYIKANGDGSWRSLPKNAGLLRCGKSCRLRWMNYLRDDVKRGNFSVEEEETIVKLHKTLGNKWSLMASHLPGRTDNEIKNYWNSHLSRRIYRYRSIDALTEADLIKIMISTNKKRSAPMARGEPKKSSGKNPNSQNADRKPPTTHDVEKQSNTEETEWDYPIGGANVESDGMWEERDRDSNLLPGPFENNQTRGVNTTGSSYGSELLVSPNVGIEGDDLGLWEGVDDDILMHFEQVLEGGVSDKNEEEDTMIIDKDGKEKENVIEKECGDWRLDIENVDLHARSSPIIPYYNDEELRWDVNGGEEEFSLWNYEKEGDMMIWW